MTAHVDVCERGTCSVRKHYCYFDRSACFPGAKRSNAGAFARFADRPTRSRLIGRLPLWKWGVQWLLLWDAGGVEEEVTRPRRKSNDKFLRVRKEKSSTNLSIYFLRDDSFEGQKGAHCKISMPAKRRQAYDLSRIKEEATSHRGTKSIYSSPASRQPTRRLRRRLAFSTPACFWCHHLHDLLLCHCLFFVVDKVVG